MFYCVVLYDSMAVCELLVRRGGSGGGAGQYRALPALSCHTLPSRTHSTQVWKCKILYPNIICKIRIIIRHDVKNVHRFINGKIPSIIISCAMRIAQLNTRVFVWVSVPV